MNNQYDETIRKIIPFYDEIHKQIFGVIQAYCEDKALSMLDTGCGTGIFALKAFEHLNISELVLCDPSEEMIAEAKKKFDNHSCEFIRIGSENLYFENRFDVVTAIQSHHYFDKLTREKAVFNCFNALKSGGIFVYFENTAPFSELGKDLMLKRLETFGFREGRTFEDVKHHSERYNKEFFPLTISEHLNLLRKMNFKTSELFWHSYMQSGFYAIKK